MCILIACSVRHLEERKYLPVGCLDCSQQSDINVSAAEGRNFSAEFKDVLHQIFHTVGMIASIIVECGLVRDLSQMCHEFLQSCHIRPHNKSCWK